jgi:hypothetical protein
LVPYAILDLFQKFAESLGNLVGSECLQEECVQDCEGCEVELDDGADAIDVAGAA